MRLNKSLLKGSLVLLISINLFNFFNFLFQFSMARILTVAQYGVLATLFSIIYIFSMFIESIQAIITKYSSGEKNLGKLKNIFKKSIKRATKYSLYLFGGFLIVSIILSFLLRIEYPLLIVTGLTVFVVFALPITRGIMQGRKSFSSLGINMIVESVLKLVIGISLVLLGFQVYGAILGALIGAGLAFLISLFSIRKVLYSEEKPAKTDKILGYSKQTFAIIFTVMVFFSLDVVMARMLFSAETAGAYALASVLAKMIFFGTLPISKAMFPLSAEKNQEGKTSHNIFYNALLILVACILVALVVFYLFSGPIIQIFSGKIVPEASGILLYLGIAVGFVSLANLILLYKLSINKVRGYLLLPSFIIVEIALMYLFSDSLFVFSVSFMVSAAALLWGTVSLLRE